MKLPVSKRWAFTPITPDPQQLNTFDQLKKLGKLVTQMKTLRSNE